MSLAILDLREMGDDGPVFSLDTGTSGFFQLRAGSALGDRAGQPWVDDVVFATPVTANPRAGAGFDSRIETSIPARRLAGARYAQLFSFKTADRASPTFSNVVELPGLVPRAPDRRDIDRRDMEPDAMTPSAPFASARRIPHIDPLARSTSTEDVLAGVVKLAAPIVTQLLAGGSGTQTQSGSTDAIGKVLAVLLQSLLGGGPSLARGQSLRDESRWTTANGNRFARSGLARQMIFGIDDALIGMLAGPILQALPQLLNAANQGRLQDKQATDKLITDLVASTNQRMLLQQLLSAQPQAVASPDLAKLAALLQQAGAGTPAPSSSTAAPGTPPLVKQASLAFDDDGVLSKRAIVSLRFAASQPWQGADKILLSRAGLCRLPFELTVGQPVPKMPLPKAIIRVIFRQAGSDKSLIEKTFKLHDLKPNTVLPLDFPPDELAAIPLNEAIDIIVETRWKAGGETIYRALGSGEAVFVGGYVLKDEGEVLEHEVELTDMTRYRPYWNKIWEAPLLDAAGGGHDGKTLWSADLAIRYAALLSASHSSNGLMETKSLLAPQESDGLNARSKGRVKAGIELSISELNKLIPLWTGRKSLSGEQLGALTNTRFAAANAGESVTQVKMDGRAGERGLIWAVPTFELRRLTLAKVVATDANGQVTGLADEIVGFPLPAAIRVIGVKNSN